MVEVAFLAPWIFFLFAGVFDFGFFAYAFISTENAARVVASYEASTGTNSSANSACTYALEELRDMSNVGSGVTTCGGTSPVSLTLGSFSDADGDAGVSATVTYQTVQFIPIPGLTGKIAITRSVQMKVNANAS